VHVLIISEHDIQLRAHLRWVPSSDFGIKVRAQTKFGLEMTAIVNQFEIDFPVWIQAHLAVSEVSNYRAHRTQELD
jgi:hypothetical protein